MNIQVSEDSDVQRSTSNIHVLGQISYKKGCLEIVIGSLKEWNNPKLIKKALEEIMTVHQNYGKFSFFSSEEARELIRKEFDYNCRKR